MYNTSRSRTRTFYTYVTFTLGDGLPLNYRFSLTGRSQMVYQCNCTHSRHPPPWLGHSFPDYFHVLYQCTRTHSLLASPSPVTHAHNTMWPLLSPTAVAPPAPGADPRTPPAAQPPRALRALRRQHAVRLHAIGQGLTLVHFSGQRKHSLWDTFGACFSPSLLDRGTRVGDQNVLG